ncbi:pentapeptide repeat-containing protein [Aliterella atlantica]|nr:pentapeptide repeat-containing protein [Aliterella atlantica]
MTADEFFARYAAGERDFFRIELTDADLSRATGWEKNNPIGQAITGTVLGEGDLSGTNFSANDMRGCNFSRSKMVRCKFILTNLTGSCFSGCDLRNCDFGGAKLIRTDLMEANLGGANMTGVDLTGADMTGANDGGAWYESALFCDTTLPDGTFLKGPHPVPD